MTIYAVQTYTFVVPVNYDLPHEALIEEAKFDWITDYDNNLIRKHPTDHLYPLPTGQIELRITLMRSNVYAGRGEIIADMDMLTVRPVLSPEFLALTKAHPDLQRQFPLIGLGSVWVDSNGSRYVLAAVGNSGGRYLRLDVDVGKWSWTCYYPAVRITSLGFPLRPTG